jgi:hypothetical protein
LLVNGLLRVAPGVHWLFTVVFTCVTVLKINVANPDIAALALEANAKPI